MISTYTFVNPLAARLFAETWNAVNLQTVIQIENAVEFDSTPTGFAKQKLQREASLFNASQKAREIGEGKDGTSAKA